MLKALQVHTTLTPSDFKRLIRRESNARVRQRLTGIMHVAAGKTTPWGRVFADRAVTRRPSGHR
jgi:hypothetical protein